MIFAPESDMALFNWAKKQPPSPPAPLAGGPVAPATAAPESEIDLLVAALKANQPGAMAALWRAVFGLDAWYFVGRRITPSGGSPYCGMLDGTPMICAFTSEARAFQFAKANNLADDAGAFPIVRIQREAAIRTALGMQQQGVAAIAFDQSVGGGYFAPLQNLVPMFADWARIPLAEAARRFELDPVELLSSRAAQTRLPQHVEELLGEFFRLKNWIFISDAQMPDRPMVWPTRDGLVTLPVFSGEHAAAVGAQMCGVRSPAGEVHMIQMPTQACVEYVQSFAAAGVEIMAVNMQSPIRLSEIRELFARYKPE